MAEPNGIRILLIGPLPPASPGTAEIIGGARVLFAETARQLEQRGFDVDLINTARPRPNLRRRKILWHEFRTLARTLRGILRQGRRADLVFLNTSAHSIYSMLVGVSIIWLLCRALRRPLALRFFGGHLSQSYQRYGPARRRLMERTFLRSALVYVETRRLGADFGNPDNFRWLPNTREFPPARPGRDKMRRLLFMGQLRMEKGLAEALAACRALPADCHLQVFGPGMPNTDWTLFDGHPRATYGGMLDHADVPRVLSEHDLLLFPSYMPSETYPGVIVEAFQSGVPVVATPIGGVPEIVEHEANGLLAEPRSAASLQAAIQRLIDDPDLYRRLCAGARRQGEFFRGSKHYDRVAEDLHKAAQERRRAGGRQASP